MRSAMGVTSLAWCAAPGALDIHVPFHIGLEAWKRHFIVPNQYIGASGKAVFVGFYLVLHDASRSGNLLHLVLSLSTVGGVLEACSNERCIDTVRA
jgi:hypothetical protein